MRITSDHVRSYGQGYDEYYAKIPEKYEAKWAKKLNNIKLSDEQIEFLKKPSRHITVAIISENWCPDCATAVHTLGMMEKESKFINLQIINRQLVPELLGDYEINGHAKVPIIIFLNDDFEEITRYIEKSTYYWTLIHEAKTRSFNKTTEEATSIKKEVFRGKGQKLVDEVIKEIFIALQRAFWIINASNPLQKLDQIINNSIPQ